MFQTQHTMQCSKDSTFGSRFAFTVRGMRRRFSPDKVLTVLKEQYRRGNVLFTTDGSAHISYDGEQEVVIGSEAIQALQDLSDIVNMHTYLQSVLH